MKSFFLLLLICFGVCFLFPNDEEIRVRVISNSESEMDIVYKKEVVEFLKISLRDKDKAEKQAKLLLKQKGDY